MNLLNWLSQEEIGKIFTTSELCGDIYYHLLTPLKIEFSSKIVNQARLDYNPKIEKGGFYVGTVKKHKNGRRFILIDKVIYISNTSPDPTHSYGYNKEEFRTNIKTIFSEGKIPFLFHTHPTHGNDILQQQVLFIKQINTSLLDKKASFNFTYKSGDIRISIPCILVVANGKTKNSLFIGLYNGIVTPVEFTKHKEKIIEKGTKDMLEATSKFCVKNPVTSMLMGGAAIFSLIKYPNAVMPTFDSIRTTATTVIISNQERNLYFGISLRQEKLVIGIPKLTKELLLAHEYFLKGLK